MAENESLQSLYERYMQNQLTAEELEQFMQYAETPEGREALSSLVDASWDDMYHPVAEVVDLRPRRHWYRIAAAAVILLAVAVGAYFILKPAEQPATLAHHPPGNHISNDILPGGNKATLTLADGSTIILDSANNGNISKQGNVTVTKLDDGKLAYDNGDAASHTIVYNTITTPRGGQYQVVLADGSKVWLNAASSLTFPTSFPGSDREVKITGEAYFEVAHDAAKPFRVGVGDMKVDVLGTHFNVNAYKDEGVIKTTLLEGSVRVCEGNESVVIMPGEQVQVIEMNHKMVIDKNVDLAEVVAWKNGRFAFSDADIKTVMRQLARWYNFNMEFKGEIKDRFHVEMTRNTNLSNVFKILEATGGVHFRIEQNKVIVMP